MQNLLRALGDRRIALQDGKQSQKGFTLVELLVVVIIIGILAGIAIPVFLNQRQAAWRAEVETDLKNAALAIETDAVTNAGGTYDTAYDDDALAAAGFTSSTEGSATETTFVVAVDTDANTYTIVANHEELDENATYSSATSSIAWAAPAQP